MIIGIDANEANQKVRVGSGVYAFELLRQFEKYKIPNIKYQIYLKDAPIDDLPKESARWRYKIISPKSFWTQLGLPIRLWRERILREAPEVFFSLTHYAPRFCPIPSVITIFDLSFIRFPEMFLKKDLYKLKHWTEYSLRQAKKIITISEFSKKEIKDYYQVPEEKIAVAYPGYDEERFNSKIKKQKTKIKSLLKKFQIEGDYFLYVGTLQPRKNLIRLLRAFFLLKNKGNQLNSEKFKLVISGMVNEGRGGWLMDNFRFQIANFKLENDVILTGYLSGQDLPYLMVGAKALILPSLYEGFGIPAVEAMACGCPVVVSKVSSLPEVCGQAAIYIENPLNVNSIVFSLHKVLTLGRGELENLIKLGFRQVQKFSWQKSAERILKVLQSDL